MKWIAEPTFAQRAAVISRRSDVPCSTVSCSNAFNDGSQISEHARSAFIGIGYPTILDGSIDTGAAPPLSPRPRALNFLQKLMCEALLIAGNCVLPFASGPRKMADPVTTLEVQ
jgi:hypothetical protein